jgi:hypothetical protein
MIGTSRSRQTSKSLQVCPRFPWRRHRLDQLARSVVQTGLDRIKSIVEKIGFPTEPATSRHCWSWPSLHRSTPGSFRFLHRDGTRLSVKLR